MNPDLIQIWKNFVSLPDAGAAPAESRGALKGAILCVSAVALFNLAWFNRFFPVTEGWFSAYAQRWLSGFLPYRDTAFFLPPLYPWQLSLWTELFGPSFLALRVLGLLVLAALTFTVYSLFRRLAPPIGASFAAFTAVLCFESFNVFIPYDYHSFDTLYALLSVLFVIKAVETGQAGAAPGKEKAFCFLAGSFASCCLLVKHSMGVLLVFTVIVLFAAAYLRAPASRRLKSVFLFCAGLALPFAIFLAWLYAWSSPAGFYNDVILGVGAKGNLGSILFGFLRLQLTAAFIARSLAALALLFLFSAPAKNAAENERGEGLGWKTLAALMVLVVANHLLIRWSARFGSFSLNDQLGGLMVPLAIIGSLLAFSRFPRVLRDGPEAPSFSVLAVAALSLCLMYSTALSTVISAPGAFLGLGLLLCMLYNRLRTVKWGLVLFLAVFALYADGVVAAKYKRPYYWWTIRSGDIRGKLVGFDLPLLRGIYTTPENKASIEGTARFITENTQPGESIFAYPSIPLFYVLSDRWPVTRALQHWYDTVSDGLALKDLDALKASPPKVIVLLDLPEAAIIEHEKLFRGGRPSAQREILKWLSEQTSVQAGKYSAQSSYNLGNGAFLRIWKCI